MKKLTPKPASPATRRDFLKKSTLGAAAVVAGVASPAKAKRSVAEAPIVAPVLGANDQIVAGFIGVGGQGYYSHLLNVINIDDNGAPPARYAFHNAVGAAACDLFSCSAGPRDGCIGACASNCGPQCSSLRARGLSGSAGQPGY